MKNAINVVMDWLIPERVKLKSAHACLDLLDRALERETARRLTAEEELGRVQGSNVELWNTVDELKASEEGLRSALDSEISLSNAVQDEVDQLEQKVAGLEKALFIERAVAEYLADNWTVAHKLLTKKQRAAYEKMRKEMFCKEGAKSA